MSPSTDRPTSDARHPQAQDAGENAAAPIDAPALESRDLLQGRKVVQIRHNGETYRLQATRLGKLILTK